jgi:hypothetical protein
LLLFTWSVSGVARIFVSGGKTMVRHCETIVSYSGKKVLFSSDHIQWGLVLLHNRTTSL